LICEERLFWYYFFSFFLQNGFENSFCKFIIIQKSGSVHVYCSIVVLMDNKQFFQMLNFISSNWDIFFYVKILFTQVLFTKWGLFSEYEWKHYLDFFCLIQYFGAMCEVTIILHAKMYVVVIILVWPSPDLMICWATLDGKFFLDWSTNNME